jgi:signal peptidase I
MRWRLAALVDGLIFVVLVLVVFAVLGSRLVGASGRTLIIVTGDSMKPTIARGALLVVEQVAVDDLAVGDVVTLQSRPTSALVTHRIARIVERDDGPWLETWGDANADPDPVLVPARVVTGRVTMSLGGLGRALATAHSPAGLVTFGGVIGLLVVTSLALWDGGRRRGRRASGATPGVEMVPIDIRENAPPCAR